MARGTSVRGGARARLSAIIVGCVGAGAVVAGVSPSSSMGSAHAEASSFVSLVPARVLETRAGLSTVDGEFSGVGMRDAQSVTVLAVAGRAGVAVDTKAVVLNVAVTGSTAPGYVTVWPCGVERPNAASLNHSAGQDDLERSHHSSGSRRADLHLHARCHPPRDRRDRGVSDHVEVRIARARSPAGDPAGDGDDGRRVRGSRDP